MAGRSFRRPLEAFGQQILLAYLGYQALVLLWVMLVSEEAIDRFRNLNKREVEDELKSIL